jgi:hypothetical protein
MKFNWGHKLFLVYSLFVVGILLLCYKSSQQKFDLVQEDYYGAELKYQSVIDASQRASAKGGELMILIKEGKMIVQLPAAFAKAEVIAEAKLYCIADAKGDLTKKTSTTNGQLAIELLSTTRGNYTLKLMLEQKGLTYYFEKKVLI